MSEPATTSPAPRFPGVYVATATTFRDDGALDLDAFAANCQRLAAAGVHGLVPNGSLGEYEAMSDEERAAVVKTAMDAAGGAEVVPGVSAKSGHEARRWAEQAAQAGCRAVMCLPPTAHAPTADEVAAHFHEVARVGLPIIAYNNPFSTRVDLTPSLLARLADEIEQVVAVKEFSQDVRRVAAIRQAAPRIEVICGCDDTFVEAMLMGATGWIAGFANSLPAESVELYELCAAGRFDEAVAAYLPMLPLLRWDADPRFVQAIKLTMDELGQHGGPVRLPRLPLSPADDETVRAQLRDYLDERARRGAPTPARPA